ncbi:hypothetical protein ACF3MZ_23910 [Paenibacillaceae bacterium WGS1546]|uniref:hypothetical protein n=1 Tax=Cohnella sp. WGS1546 TaxID=3366810 RepID=UPI00372D2AFC
MLPSFFEFRMLENSLEEEDTFIEILTELISKKEIKDIAKILKSTGVLINQYPGKHKYKNLIERIDKQLLEKDMTLWTLYKSQSEMLNSLFQICYKDNNYKKAEKLPRHIEIQSFLTVLELSLTSLRQDVTLPIKLDFDFAFNNHDSVVMAKEKMFNYIALIAGSILNYLVYHKKPKLEHIDYRANITNANLISSAHHFSAYDKINVLKDIVDYWRYYDCKVIQKNNAVIIEPKEKEYYLANDISLKRFETRREKLNIELEHIDLSEHEINEVTNQLPPNKFLSKDEIATYYNTKEYFYLDNLDHEILDVPFKEWIRAYSVIKLISNNFLKSRNFSDEMSLLQVCLQLDKEQLRLHLIEYGVSKKYTNCIIDKLTFGNKDTDLFDTPLLCFNENEYLIIPTLALNIDIARVLMCNFLKKKSNMDFKGTGFENQVLEELREKGICCNGLLAKGKLNENEEEREFQCDVAFILNDDLYLCECKSYSQPTTHRGFYELVDKKYDTVVDQFKKITDFYKKNLNLVRSGLNLSDSWTPRKIYKLILVSSPLGAREKIDDTYFIDHSAFSIFLERKRPSIVDIERKTGYEFSFYSFLDGDITSDKMIKLFKTPPQVDMEKKRRRRIYKEIPFGELIVKKFDFQTKFDDKISLTDKNISKYLKKIEKAYFNKKSQYN